MIRASGNHRADSLPVGMFAVLVNERHNDNDSRAPDLPLFTPPRRFKPRADPVQQERTYLFQPQYDRFRSVHGNAVEGADSPILVSAVSGTRYILRWAGTGLWVAE